MTGIEELIALLGSPVAVGTIADLLTILGPLAERYDRALLQAGQYERNQAALEAYLGNEGDAKSLLLQDMRQATQDSVDESALMGMAAEAMMRGVTSNPTLIDDLIKVAWVRGGVSATGGSSQDTAAERTARVYEELLDAIARQDIDLLVSRGFKIDEQSLAGLTEQERKDALLQQVLNDEVTKKLSALDAFTPRPYEQVVATDANAAAAAGSLVHDFSQGFWLDRLMGPLSLLVTKGMEHPPASSSATAPPWEPPVTPITGLPAMYETQVLQDTVKLPLLRQYSLDKDPAIQAMEPWIQGWSLKWEAPEEQATQPAGAEQLYILPESGAPSPQGAVRSKLTGWPTAPPWPLMPS